MQVDLVVTAAIRPYVAEGCDPQWVAGEILRGLKSAGFAVVELVEPVETDSDGEQSFSDGTGAAVSLHFSIAEKVERPVIGYGQFEKAPAAVSAAVPAYDRPRRRRRVESVREMEQQ